MRLLLLALLVSPCVCVAQPLQRGALVLDVASEQVIRTETQWQTSWGSFSRDYINKRLLFIKLRQLGAGNPIVHIRWYFIARDPGRGLFIYDSGDTEGSIAKGGVILKPYSSELVMTREKTLLAGSSKTGPEPWGWAVFVEQGKTALGETASVPELVKWTQDELRNLGPKLPPVRKKNRPQFEPIFVPR